MKKINIKHVLNLGYNADEINNNDLKVGMQYIIQLNEFYQCFSLNKHKIESGNSLNQGGGMNPVTMIILRERVMFAINVQIYGQPNEKRGWLTNMFW